MKHNKLDELNLVIVELEKQASAIDNKVGEHDKKRFDNTLFQCNSKFLLPCVKELKQTFLELSKGLKSTHKYAELPLEYLSERLFYQLSALQREMATQDLRKKEPKSRVSSQTLTDLYQKLAQHQDWERRLKMMLMDKNELLNASPITQRQQIQQDVISLEQRLVRCQKSKNYIEKRITQRERKN